MAAITGCSGAAPDAAAAPDATVALNGPYGPGGPFAAAVKAGAGPARTGAAGSAGGAGGAGNTPPAAKKAGGHAVGVSGSAGFNSIHGVPWLSALGYGVDVSAPQSVHPSTATPGDAEAGFYDAFYARQLTAACGYVVPGQRAGCPASLRTPAAAAGSLRDAALGFVVVKGDEAIVTMTGLICGGPAAPAGCLGQQDPAWIFGNSLTFDALWARIAKEGGNPLTATPLRQVSGRWYVDLTTSAAG
jgi:hypothetical protein